GRLDEPAKTWKFSLADVRERRHWGDYMTAYEEMIRHTSTPHAPWHVVPADHKWFTRLVVVAAMLDTLTSLRLAYPTVEPDRLKELEAARVTLANETAPGTTQPVARRRGSAETVSPRVSRKKSDTRDAHRIRAADAVKLARYASTG